MIDFGSVFGDLGGAVSDLFGGIGGLSEAKAYGQAAKIAQQNVAFTHESTAIQEAQTMRNAFQTIGKQQAQVSSSFEESGSAVDLLRDSTQQANLARGLINVQGAITAGGFAQQAAAYAGQAAAAKAKAGGGFLGGLLKIAGAAVSIFCEPFMKENIEMLREIEPGLNLYRFNYVDDKTQKYVGVMADEVQATYPEAIIHTQAGRMVDYSKLPDVKFEAV